MSNDLYGLMVTSNSKYAQFFDNNFNDYNVEVRFNGKVSYALCDKILRIPNNQKGNKNGTQIDKRRNIQHKATFKKVYGRNKAPNKYKGVKL